MNYKVVAIARIVDSDLSKNEKIQLLNFIKEANSTQLKQLILYGKVRGSITNEQLEEMDELLEVAPLAALIASDYVFGKAMSAATLTFNKYFGEIAQACSGKKGREKRQCRKIYTMKAYQQKINALKQEMPKCNQTSNPKKCQERFLKHIKTIEKQLLKLRAKPI